METKNLYFASWPMLYSWAQGEDIKKENILQIVPKPPNRCMSAEEYIDMLKNEESLNANVCMRYEVLYLLNAEKSDD